MDLKKLSPVVVLAGLIGFSTPACKPIQEENQEKVKKILEAVQPTDEMKDSSRGYYNGRLDLKNISGKERESLALGRAKLVRLSEKLQNGSITFSDFYTTVVKSQEQIITDKNTRLQIDNGPGSYTSISVGPKSIELWTTPGNPNIIIANYAVSKVDMQDGELRVTVSGDMYETTVTDSTAKQQIDADLSPKGTKEKGNWTVTLGLVLDKNK